MQSRLAEHSLAAGKQGEAGPPLLSEFSIAILSITCLSMGIGSGLPRDLGILAGLCGALGLTAYGLCVARKAHERRLLAVESQMRIEARLHSHASGPWPVCPSSLFDSVGS
ncbi:hypothetical protein Pan44_55320 [Caulifigura coniformis]|uniref:Uncharacterized protein n=1 Tax=Caulifigura coniformis TaxID=2527983 RepID=A0A517SMV9_9PLAN|nr:hypothetical protein [Caulifigura coniformis]QDT57463.1 hypothetical protein Pan44_55320 [Caulifigura coniformis]